MKKRAFTLAEVLITLGIIGVVAAMTIPSLIANARCQKFKTSLKKTVSRLSQAAQTSQALYGFDYSGINKRCGTDALHERPETTQSVCALLNGTLTGATFHGNSTNIKLPDGSNYSISNGYFLNYNGINSRMFYAYTLSDGTILLIYNGMGDVPCTMDIGQKLEDTYGAEAENMNRCIGLIDVNGIAPPNKEVKCTKGSDSLSKNDCIVSSKDVTDVYPFRFHDNTLAPASAAARYVLRNGKL